MSITPQKTLIQADHISYTIKTGEQTLLLIDDINLNVVAQQSIAIQGKSGVGKTTLLNLLAGFIAPSSGQLTLFGHSLQGISEPDKNRIRGSNIGFIFQDFKLIEGLTALENVLLPLALHHIDQAEDKAHHWLKLLELENRSNHLPQKLSGGEKQRVAIARAFALEPMIIFADEPTGQLDEITSQALYDLLMQLQKDQQTSLVIATHDDALATLCNQVFSLKHSKLLPRSP